MKLRVLILFLSLAPAVSKINCLTDSAVGQSLSSGSGHATGVSEELQSGAVVEAVDPNLEGDRAGVREGDILLSWSQGENRGEIHSPFDLSWTETEWKCKGPVTVQGRRGKAERIWVLGSGKWGIQTRPNLSANFLPIYKRGDDLAHKGKLGKAMALWGNSSGGAHSSRSGSPNSLLHIWLLFHAGRVLADAQQWMEADIAYQTAMQQAEEAGPVVAAQIVESWGEAFEKRNAWDEAEKRYQQAIVENRKISNDNLSLVVNLNSLGIVAFVRGDLVSRPVED
jgi:hypothetical protein